MLPLLYAQDSFEFGHEASARWNLWTLTALNGQNPIVRIIANLIGEMEPGRRLEYSSFFYDNSDASAAMPCDDINAIEGDIV